MRGYGEVSRKQTANVSVQESVSRVCRRWNLSRRDSNRADLSLDK